MQEVIIFTQKGCKFSQDAVKFFKARGDKVDERDIHQDPELWTKLQVTPIIIIGCDIHTGFDPKRYGSDMVYDHSVGHFTDKRDDTEITVKHTQKISKEFDF